MKTTQRQWPSSLFRRCISELVHDCFSLREPGQNSYQEPPPPPEFELDELPELPLLPDDVELAASAMFPHRPLYQSVRLEKPAGSAAQAASQGPAVVVENAARRASEQKQAS